LKFIELTQKEFMDFEQSHPLGMFMQTSYQHDLVEKRQWQSSYVGIIDHDQIVAGALLNSTNIFLGKLFEISGGPVMDFSDGKVVRFFLSELKKYVRANGGILLKIIPNLHSKKFDDEGNILANLNQQAHENLVSAGAVYDNHQPIVSYEFIKDLTGLDEDKLIASYNKDGKYYLNKTREFGIHYRELTYEELPLFKKYTQLTADRIGFKDKELAYYQEAFDAYGEQVKFLVAELNLNDFQEKQQVVMDSLQVDINNLEKDLLEKPNHKKKKKQLKEYQAQYQQHQKRVNEAKDLITQNGESILLAGAMFIIQPQEVTYLFSFTNEMFKKFYGPYGIQHLMMSYAVTHQIPRYNFYGVKGVFDGSDGVLKFKQSFNGYTYKYLGIYTIVAKPFKYQLSSVLKKLLGRTE
jgi:alanine adding enzyme